MRQTVCLGVEQKRERRNVREDERSNGHDKQQHRFIFVQFALIVEAIAKSQRSAGCFARLSES